MVNFLAELLDAILYLSSLTTFVQPLTHYIEHTNLSPTLTIQDIDKLVAEAKQYHFLGVCVPPFWVKRVKREIGEEKVLLVTVAGFPLGYSMTETKLEEIQRAIDNGADEVDVVWNISSFKSSNPWTKIEIAKCSKLAHDNQKALKVIIETAYLSDDEIVEACKICVNAGADFVKTSTGFAPSGAKVEHIQLMKRSVPSGVGIKASGGIKTKEQAIQFIEAGADRLGTSSGIAIVAV
jgi:deoxyribose-phosphate aldolase